MIRHLALVALSAMTLAACATSYSLAPVGGDAVAVNFVKGRPTLASHAASGTIKVVPLQTSFDGRMFLAVVAYNQGGLPANLGYENINVSVDGQALPLHSFSQLEHDEKVKAGWGKFAVALAGGLEAAANENAAHSYSSGRVYAGGYSAGFKAETYNPGVALALDRQTADRVSAGFDNIDERLDTRLAELDAKVLRTTTIQPGATDGGVVVIDKPDLSKAPVRRLSVTVSFNGEEHHFSFYAVRDGATAPQMLQAQADAVPASLFPQNRQEAPNEGVARGGGAGLPLMRAAASPQPVQNYDAGMRWYPDTGHTVSPPQFTHVVVSYGSN